VAEGGKDKMKPFKDKLSDEEIKALVAYVRSLKK
jgi:mono/diheme cytochrome c family protein